MLAPRGERRSLSIVEGLSREYRYSSARMESIAPGIPVAYSDLSSFQ